MKMFYIEDKTILVKNGKSVIPNDTKYICLYVKKRKSFNNDEIKAFPKSITKFDFENYGPKPSDLIDLVILDDKLILPDNLKSFTITTSGCYFHKNNISIFPKSVVYLNIYTGDPIGGFCDASGRSIFPKTLRHLILRTYGNNLNFFIFEKNEKRILPKNLKSLEFYETQLSHIIKNGINYMPPNLKKFKYTISHKDVRMPPRFLDSLPKTLCYISLNGSWREKPGISHFINDPEYFDTENSVLPKLLKILKFKMINFDIPMVNKYGERFIPDSVEVLHIALCSNVSLVANNASILPPNLKALDIYETDVRFIDETHTIKALPETLEYFKYKYSKYDNFVIPENDVFIGKNRRLLPNNLKTLILYAAPEQYPLIIDNIRVLPDNLSCFKIYYYDDEVFYHEPYIINDISIFPDKIKRLDIKMSNNQDLYHYKDGGIIKAIPNSVKYLILPDEYNKPLCVDGVNLLPDNLITLELGDKFNSDLFDSYSGTSVLPESLIYLSVGSNFNKPLIVNDIPVLPSSIKFFKVGYSFNQPLQINGNNALPCGIESVDLYESLNYNYPLIYENLKVFPDSIENLKLSVMFRQPLYQPLYQPLNQSLNQSLNHTSNGSLNKSISLLPTKLKEITISPAFDDYHNISALCERVTYKAFPHNMIKILLTDSHNEECEYDTIDDIKICSLIEKTFPPLNPLAEEIIENFHLAKFYMKDILNDDEY